MKRLAAKCLLVGVPIMLLLGGAILWADWYFAVTYVWDRDINNQQIIGKAYVRYYLEKQRFPENLEALVTASYLPAKADFYLEPPGFASLEPDVRMSCYIVGPPPDGDITRLEMIGRRSFQNDKTKVRYDAVANAIIRDEIIEKKVPRDEKAYQEYIAPLEEARQQRQSATP